MLAIISSLSFTLMSFDTGFRSHLSGNLPHCGSARIGFIQQHNRAANVTVYSDLRIKRDLAKESGASAESQTLAPASAKYCQI